MYNVGMYCKHFKGKNLLEKNIYKILKVNVTGKDIKDKNIIYTGDKENLNDVKNLVVYENIFQKNKIFAREEESLCQKISVEKQKEFNQIYRVQPLTKEEITIIKSKKFILEKREYEFNKNK